MTTAPNPEAAALALYTAWQNGPLVPTDAVQPGDAAGAYAIQDATLRRLGAVGGWKVGAKSPEAEPICAPLPLARLLPSGSTLTGSTWQRRGVEVEVAIRLGRDLTVDGPHTPLPTLLACIDAMLPAIEVVETRLSDWQPCAPRSALAQLADLQSHGALILGAPSLLDPASVDLRTAEASLSFSGQSVARTHGGNPAADLWRLLRWLAWQCTRRGQPWQAGQVITTGSCTGMLFAPEGARVQGQLAGLGTVELQF